MNSKEQRSFGYASILIIYFSALQKSNNFSYYGVIVISTIVQIDRELFLILGTYATSIQKQMNF